jgi:hypothetical protein
MARASGADATTQHRGTSAFQALQLERASFQLQGTFAKIDKVRGGVKRVHGGSFPVFPLPMGVKGMNDDFLRYYTLDQKWSKI